LEVRGDRLSGLIGVLSRLSEVLIHPGQGVLGLVGPIGERIRDVFGGGIGLAYGTAEVAFYLDGGHPDSGQDAVQLAVDLCREPGDIPGDLYPGGTNIHADQRTGARDVTAPCHRVASHVRWPYGRVPSPALEPGR